MHAPPSVTYPVGRSVFAGALLAAIALAALGAVAAWSLQAPAGWRQVAGVAALVATGTLAWQAWRRSPAGRLHWDGTAWTWEEGGAVAAGHPELALDLQGHMFLRWRGEEGRVRWLWLERASDTSHWDALRRAVYSRASTHVPADGKPPAAEQ